MKIYVVKSCDGDVYYSASRKAHKDAAMEFATDQVLVGNSSIYDREDLMSVRGAKDAKDWPNLWKALIDCGAIREAYTRE